MYVPEHFSLSDERIVDILTSVRVADLVTFGEAGLTATRVPMVYDPSVGDRGALLCHLQRNNTQWTHTAHEALVIVNGPEHYVSPTWFPEGPPTAVPTWDYITVHARGALVAHTDPEWLRTQVSMLSDRFEPTDDTRWTLDDAPTDHVDRMLRAIVGVEIRLTTWEGKAKMSQNKPVGNLETQVLRLGAHPAAAFKRDVSLPTARAKQELVDGVRNRLQKS